MPAPLSQKKYKESLNLVNKILNTNPDHQPSLRDKGHILFYLEELDEARKNVEKSMKNRSKSASKIRFRGRHKSCFRAFENRVLELSTIDVQGLQKSIFYFLFSI